MMEQLHQNMLEAYDHIKLLWIKSTSAGPRCQLVCVMNQIYF